MILTMKLRFLKYENVTLLLDGTKQVIETITLQQWSDPDLLAGELVGAWQDIPSVISDRVNK